MGALVATRYNPRSSDTLVANGNPRLVPIIATARKLLTILNAIIRERKPWQSTEHQTVAPDKREGDPTVESS
jgi:transposase